VLDRLRIDEIVLVPDGALPLTPLPNYGQMDGQPNEYTHPNKSDRTVDLQWGFPAKETPFYTDLYTIDNGSDFYLKGRCSTSSGTRGTSSTCTDGTSGRARRTEAASPSPRGKPSSGRR